jgi:acyl carrier protein
MTRGSLTSAKLARLVSDVCGVPPAAIGMSARLRGYGLDSIRASELVVLVEDEFGLQFRLEDLRNVQTLADLTNRVERALAARDVDGDTARNP